VVHQGLVDLRGRNRIVQEPLIVVLRVEHVGPVRLDLPGVTLIVGDTNEDAVVVSAVTGSTVYLSTPLRFNFGAGERVTAALWAQYPDSIKFTAEMPGVFFYAIWMEGVPARDPQPLFYADGVLFTQMLVQVFILIRIMTRARISKNEYSNAGLGTSSACPCWTES